LDKKGVVTLQDAITVSDNELLKMYYKFYFSLGRVPTQKDLDSSNEIYNAEVYLNRFGTMSNLRRLSGVPQIKVTSLEISQDEIKQDLISIYKNFGKPTSKRLSELSPYGIATICNIFNTNSLSNIWKEIENELKKEEND